MTEVTNHNPYQSAFDAGAARNPVIDIEGRKHIVLPPGYSREEIPEHHLRDRPRAIDQVTNHLTVKSFVDYWKRFANNDVSTLYVSDPDKAAFKAVIDATAPELPSWEKHRALYACRKSTEWTIWTSYDATKMTQGDFARFIERNLGDVVEPAAAKLLAMAKEFQATRKVVFKSGTNLQNGDIQLTFQEMTNEGAGGKGTIQMPEKIKIGIPVFFEGARYTVDAFFKYRVPREEDEALQMWFELDRPDLVREHAFNEVVEQIVKETGAQHVFQTVF